MNKVKCTNGHFYDADRFQICPICGSESTVAAMKEVSKKPVDEISQTEPLLPSTEPNGESVGIPKISPPKIDELAPTEIIHPEDEIRPNEEAPDNHSPNLNPHSATGGAIPVNITQEKAAPSMLSEAVAGTRSMDISPLPKTVSYYDIDDTEPPVGWLVCVKGPYQGRAFECNVGRNRIGRSPDMDICLIEDNAVTRESHAILIYEPQKRQFYLQAGTGDGLAYLNNDVLFAHEELHAYDKISLGNSEFIFLPLCGDRFTWDEYIAEG